jgi:hypothetical protein
MVLKAHLLRDKQLEADATCNIWKIRQLNFLAQIDAYSTKIL